MSTRVHLELLEAGSCHALEYVVLRTGGLNQLRFPAIFGVIEHPTRGIALFDTGYARHLTHLCERWPERLYALLLPVDLPPADEAVRQLAARGIAAEQVETIILSHFHVDHVAGLRNFPRARFVFPRRAWEAVQGRRGIDALRRAYMPELLPEDFVARATPFDDTAHTPLEEEWMPFTEAFDVFGDGSVRAVELSGHATGQHGLIIRTVDDGDVLLIADATWTSRSFQQARLPHPITSLIFDDWDAYAASLGRIHTLHRRRPELRIVPSHCQEALEAWRRCRRPR